MGFFKWLYPGLKLKRWVILCSLGVLTCSMGFVMTIVESQETAGSLLVVAGLAAVVISIRKMVKSVTAVLMPSREGELLNILYSRGVLSSGPRIVAIGGGTGLSVLLQGLKERTSNLTAIVTVTDDGGSSGRLRNQFKVLPPGDIRNCLVALADAETMMRELFQYRFSQESASDLGGHSFGNLFILAMTQITGDFERAIRESSRILNIRGRVIPSTLTPVALVAEHADGTRQEGETVIAAHGSRIDHLALQPQDCRATEEAIEAVRRADAIVFGPGSLYTSVLPNLLIRDLREAILATSVPRIYVCNIMTQPHETSHLATDFQHVDALIRHTCPELISHCIVNTGRVPPALEAAYAERSSYPLKSEADKIRALGYEVIGTDLVSSADFVRHNPRKLAKIVAEIAAGRNGAPRKRF
jgi:uncharacterized cofD-like protein